MALDSVLASVGRLVCVLYVVLMVAVGMKLLLMASDRQELRALTFSVAAIARSPVEFCSCAAYDNEYP